MLGWNCEVVDPNKFQRTPKEEIIQSECCHFFAPDLGQGEDDCKQRPETCPGSTIEDGITDSDQFVV